jgi:hypothetical protein
VIEGGEIPVIVGTIRAAIPVSADILMSLGIWSPIQGRRQADSPLSAKRDSLATRTSYRMLSPVTTAIEANTLSVPTVIVRLVAWNAVPAY